MPAPTNIDFLSATDIGTTLPYNNTQDVRDSGTNYTVYYKYTVQPGDIEIGVFGFGAVAPGYQPICNVYLGPAGAPTPYTTLANITGTNVPIQIPVAQIVGQDLFFEFVSLTGNGPTPAVLTLLIQAKNSVTWAVGDIFISDDTVSLPAAILDGTTGAIKRFIDPFPAGEAGDILPDGTILHEDLENGEFDLYDSTITKITDVAFTGVGSPVLRACIGGDCFYAGYGGSGGTHALVKRISKTGVIGSTIGPFATAGLTAIAAKDDETILYYAATIGGAVKTWNIAGNIAGADLIAGIAGYSIVDILYLSNNTLIVGYYNGTTKDLIVKNIDTTGAVLHTYSFGTAHAGTTPRLFYAIDSPASFWIWEHLSGVTSALKSKLSNILIADGSTITTFSVPEFEGGAYNGVATATPSGYFGNSFSCPAFILRSSSAVSASLIIVKTTIPAGAAQEFDFTTTGGLLPDTFTLEDGESQEYLGISPGVYGVTEETVVGWDTEYSVSNGDNHDAITLADGDEVTVVVTNTRIAGSRAGIYKVVPGKRNDTLWINVATDETEDVKIPDPNFKTALIGE